MKKYQERFYRYQLAESDLLSFQVKVKQTDLWIRAEKVLTREAKDLIITFRKHIEDFIRQQPAFLKSLAPIPLPVFTAQAIVREMIVAGQKAGT